MTDRELAGLGSRAAAQVVDVVVLFVLGYVIALATGGTTAGGFSLQGLPALVYVAASVGYFVVLEAEYGQTAGKRALGIRVVGESGPGIDYRASAIRNVLRIVDFVPGFYVLGAALILTTDDEQRVGDSVAETLVVEA